MKPIATPGLDRACAVNALFIPENGAFPNHPRWPLLVYRRAFALEGADPASVIEARFHANGWRGTWRDGIYSFHHFHSNSHEALGCSRGSASVLFGGPHGYRLNLKAGDVVVLPAGTAHKRMEASRDFQVVGAYPGDGDYDMRYGKPEERDEAVRAIAGVPLPEKDPVFGKSGGLLAHWKAHDLMTP